MFLLFFYSKLAHSYTFFSGNVFICNSYYFIECKQIYSRGEKHPVISYFVIEYTSIVTLPRFPGIVAPRIFSATHYTLSYFSRRGSTSKKPPDICLCLELVRSWQCKKISFQKYYSSYLPSSRLHKANMFWIANAIVFRFRAKNLFNENGGCDTRGCLAFLTTVKTNLSGIARSKVWKNELKWFSRVVDFKIFLPEPGKIVVYFDRTNFSICVYLMFALALKFEGKFLLFWYKFLDRLVTFKIMMQRFNVKIVNRLQYPASHKTVLIFCNY